MKNFLVLRAKRYSYILNDVSEEIMEKTQKSVS